MQCALVCKAWTHRSQHHLFTRLTYHSRITRSPRDFAEFLLTRPNIAGHVLSLEILDRMSLSLAIVRLIILALPHLRTLLFRAAMISSADDADIALGQRPNPRTEAIKKLTFMNCMAACDTLYSILGIFPAIGTLVLDDRCGGLIHCQPASPAIRDLAIERIETSSVSNSLLAALVHGSRMEETITSAKIIAIGKESDTPEELGEALQSMTSLRTLQLLPLGLDLTSASNSTRKFCLFVF
ncbi:hypothetical protein L226DRAFT_257930 [Lentinus tigrinus ALCF2SS1-7]|nr:hypothetical protein L226DRAFT_257930 [Lentinus tigrinus ALCF2SS1-7]